MRSGLGFEAGRDQPSILFNRDARATVDRRHLGPFSAQLGAAFHGPSFGFVFPLPRRLDRVKFRLWANFILKNIS
jgi:hypothetical protein